MYRTDRFAKKKDYLRDSMPFARLIPFGNTAVVVNKDGSLMTTWNFCGPDLGSSVADDLAQITRQLNNTFMDLESGHVLWFEAKREESISYQTPKNMPDLVSKAIEEERMEYFSSGVHFESEYFCTLYWYPPSDNEDKMQELIMEDRQKTSLSIVEMIEKFFKISDKIITFFRRFQIPCDYLTPTEMMTYLHSMVSDDPREIAVPNHPVFLDNYLYDTPFYGGLTPRLGKKHLRVVTITQYASSTIFGFFDALNQLNFSYRWVTRFFCVSKLDNLSELEHVSSQWYGKIKPLLSMLKEIVSGRESDSNNNLNAMMKHGETKDAITAVENDTTRYGYYSIMIVVADEDQARVEAQANIVVNLLESMNLKAKVEGLNAVEAYFGSIPGNVGQFIRRPMISTGNLTHMIPLSNVWSGFKTNEHLKNAPPLLYAQTSGNTPFRINLHIGDVGHSMMIGHTGGGKSVHLNLIEAQWRKYKNSRVFVFDKGASSIALTLGVGGDFYDLGSETQNSLSFQPLLHADDPHEQAWLLDWFTNFLETEHVTVTPAYSNKILQAIQVVANYPDPRSRRLTNFVAIINDPVLQQALRPLTLKGAYGRMFDSAEENLSFSNFQTFEMEKIMQEKQIVSTMLMYIFHRIEQSLKGDPTLIVLDECWVFFENEQFSKKIAEWLRVLRKFNACVLFATQEIESIINSPIFTTVNTNCVTKIFLPDHRSITDEVLKTYSAFGLNPKQVQIIHDATSKRDYYYLSIKGARLYNLALDHCEVAMAYIAVNKKDIDEARKIMELYPKEEFNRYWLEYRKSMSESEE